MPRNQRPFGGAGEVAAPSRRDERSGLLDIRTLSSIVDSQQRARASHASASSVALPAFTNAWALQDVSAPAPAANRPPPRKLATPDQRPLYMMILALSAAVVSLGALIAFRPSPTVVVERTVTPVSAPAVTSAPEDAAELEREREPTKDPVAVAEPAEEETPDQGRDGQAKDEQAKDGAKSKRPRSTRPSRPAKSPPTSKDEAKPAKPTKSEGTIPVECVIDPSKCSRSGKKKPDPSDDTSSTKGLPPAPSSTAIRSAMNEVKPQAKACGPKHGGRSGEKVRIKLSVAGSTGQVTSATALDDHAGTALGRCVAGALSKAKLPRFSKPQAGVVYAVTL
ncbi:hypothetical protein [Paraliomyxa miuraensis]|uniref:hypothetical protein n=1 Tax=Paraliomyxa miuraensis TaxID=376150 RepID=UPI00224C990E|nr:hypothetical protein [Paraliomyxa miuraensis]MCX4247155.1 hypothetical protein [Paraliomyxa miuraensis]